MLQTSSQMARVQDFLATEECGDSSHHMDLTFEDWEAAVTSMKYHLRKTLGFHIATYKELLTLLAEIQACLHSRPLCALSSDPFNLTYLSPGHFLIGKPLTQLPSADNANVTCSRLSRWQSPNNFNSFGNDTHPTICRVFNSQRWQRKSSNLQPGDHVLLREDNTTPLHWPTTVIINIHPHQMASYAWSHLGIPRELQQTNHYKNFTLTACE